MEQPRVIYQPFKRLKMALRSKKRKRSSITMGVVTTILASLSFTFMSACAKWLPEMPSGEMTLFRGIVGLFFIPLLCLQTKEHFFSGKHKCMLCLRGLFGSIALFFYFLSIEGLTLGGFTNPLTARCLLYVSPVSDFFERKTSPSGDSWDAFHCDRDPLRGADLEFQCI